MTGKFVSVKGDKVTYTPPTGGPDKKLTVDKDATITRDGHGAVLADFVAGDELSWDEEPAKSLTATSVSP